ncbi:30S ribosomal protein THX [Mucilaginibacter sp. RS28]|uniref:30S ribosomal protein THX n=1 Tax=Mucilaginibacter straminoryzae TaxID=2932774 RepID=A0A9X2B8T8_9SPHI|nr:30S ribosomal protein THX [Mucilaginibacter straminoryzae]MCJ8209055.1 30S ribosomal protein THX [Mucilaginibacter straminoryzae]
MGKGDRKSRKGKIVKGSFGKKRPHKVKPKTETLKTEKEA